MPNSARNIFIETSISIERILGRRARPDPRDPVKRGKEQIQATLKGAKVSTSSYVWMEFRRTVLQAKEINKFLIVSYDGTFLLDNPLTPFGKGERKVWMAYLLTIIRQMQQEGETDIFFSELMKRVATGAAIGYSQRVIQRVLLAYGYILETFPRSPVRATTLIDYLEFNIEHVIPARFFQGIDEFITNTDCDLVRPNVPVGDYFQSRLSCNAVTAQCSIVDFLASHQEKLLALEHTMAQANLLRINPNTLKALRRVNKDPTKVKGERTCWALSDVIIALEAPVENPDLSGTML
jgi:hypothetical protein